MEVKAAAQLSAVSARVTLFLKRVGKGRPGSPVTRLSQRPYVIVSVLFGRSKKAFLARLAAANKKSANSAQFL
jgi:hypothetical protein